MATSIPPLRAIVLTFNEELHIARCLESIRYVCASITVIDSGSTDRTVELARSFGAEVVVNKWVNYATQMNIGINHLAGREGWLLRIDADEYLTQPSARMLPSTLADLDATVDGVLVRRQIVFLGRRIRWGGIEPSWQLRIWRNGRGTCEQRWMDEHIVVKGGVSRSAIDVVDENLNSINWWTAKHNHYASREVIDVLASRGLLLSNEDLARSSASRQAKIKRLIKERLYNQMPGGLRSMAYVFYRYVLRMGFLDGAQGYFFHFLQGFWYRTLVDAKLKEILTEADTTGRPLAEVIRRKTGIDVEGKAANPGPLDQQEGDWHGVRAEAQIGIVESACTSRGEGEGGIETVPVPLE